MRSPIPFRHLIQVLCGSVLILAFISAISRRVFHAYLEDDLLWFIPFILQLAEKNDLWAFIRLLHTGDLLLIDGIYFLFLVFAFGLNFGGHVIVSVIIHFVNAILFYILLKKRLHLTFETSFASAFIYLLFYGHFHVYAWPFSAHHLLVFFFFFSILCLYLKADALMDQEKHGTRYYWLTLLFSVAASFQRLSILIIPLTIFLHIIFATSDNRKILKKYTLWLPLFSIFIIYPSIVLLMGGHGDVLSKFLGPFYDVMGKTQSPFRILGWVVVCVICLFSFRFILAKLLSKKDEDFLHSIIAKLSLGCLLIPQVVFLCLCVFVWPFSSALEDDVMMRWQGIASPFLAGPLMAAGWLLTVMMMACFLWVMIKQNRHLIIFIPLYVMTVSFFSTHGVYLSSRYLLYAVPILSVTLCISCVEILPRILSDRVKTRYLSAFSALIFLILFFNIAAIKWRLDRTGIVDYHWGYDYVKIASVIRDDLQRNGDSSGHLCISGLQDIPYKGGWRQGILSYFDFNRYDPFRLILTSVLKKRNIHLTIAENCEGSGRHYQINDFTVLDDRGESVEPFYRYFQSALKSLGEGDMAKAAEALEQAVYHKPFLIRFVFDGRATQAMPSGFLMEKAADVIYKIYATYYDGDGKMNYIDNMIQIEAQDYGMALALLSYFKGASESREESAALLKEASLFMAKEDVMDYPRWAYHADAKFGDFYDFIEKNDTVFSRRIMPRAGVSVETYKGFNIVWHEDFYFALPENEGQFSLVKYKNKRYKNCFVAKTRHEVKDSIDALGLDYSQEKGTAEEVSGRVLLDAQGFRVIKKGDMYYGFAVRLRRRQVGEELVFKARSLLEAKLVLQTFSEL